MARGLMMGVNETTRLICILHRPVFGKSALNVPYRVYGYTEDKYFSVTVELLLCENGLRNQMNLKSVSSLTRVKVEEVISQLTKSIICLSTVDNLKTKRDIQ